MKILHLSTGINRQSAAYRLHLALLKTGVDSYIYAGLGSIEEDKIFINERKLQLKLTAKLERQLLKLYPNRENKPWNLSLFNNALGEVIAKINPDIIHLHWICQFVSIGQLPNFDVPVVWTMHDSWPFTGGCHIPGQCDKYRKGCGKCPQLNSKRRFDLSKYIQNSKAKAWQNIAINFIGPSKWITSEARSSNLLTHHSITNIPNCIDTELYSRKDQELSRKKLGIPLNKKIILFGANNALQDENKGYDLLKKSFERITNSRKREDIELVLFGTKEKGFCDKTKIRKLGFIDDPQLFPYIYSSADVLVSASRSENFSNVILESLSCGTPVVAFDIGGNSDLIKPGSNGSLVPPYNEKMMSEEIMKHLFTYSISSEVTSKSVSMFCESNVSNKHMSLYRDILQ